MKLNTFPAWSTTLLRFLRKFLAGLMPNLELTVDRNVVRFTLLFDIYDLIYICVCVGARGGMQYIKPYNFIEH